MHFNRWEFLVPRWNIKAEMFRVSHNLSRSFSLFPFPTLRTMNLKYFFPVIYINLAHCAYRTDENFWCLNGTSKCWDKVSKHPHQAVRKVHWRRVKISARYGYWYNLTVIPDHSCSCVLVLEMAPDIIQLRNPCIWYHWIVEIENHAKQWILKCVP